MKVYDHGLPGLKVIEVKQYRDDRGFFSERFSEPAFRSMGLPGAFLQDNHSRSIPGVVRGLHFQFDKPQSKLVGVIRGRIWDVAVDIRKGSSTFGKWASLELDGDEGKLFWIPAGFAHGFCVIGEEPADVLYKVDAVYNKQGEGGIHWADPQLAIKWPISDPNVSERDQILPKLSKLVVPFSI